MIPDPLSTIDMCTILPAPDLLRAAERATTKSPDNAPERTSALRSRLVAERVAAFTKKLWSTERARHLRVHFVGGADALQERVAAMAKEWEQHANVRFVFGVRDADAEIRVAFEDRGHGLFVGSDASRSFATRRP
ncbi:MAG: hypothetical protein U5L04_01370 [Trueperaceae bacterium]|nr:hypothetical protein [Trueperaceae bacterium]